MDVRPDLLGTRDGRHAGGTLAVEPSQGLQSVLRADGGESNPRVITLSFSVAIPFPNEANPEPFPAPARPTLLASLEWGISSANHQALFDWARGGSVTITATSFHLKGGYASNSTGPKCTLIASAAYETRSSTEANRVTLTRPFLNLAPANPITFWVPHWARLFTLILADSAALRAGAIEIEMLALDGTVLYRYRPLGSAIADAVELPNAVYFIRLTTTGAPMDGAALFTLAL